ncbi:MAG TPA: 1,2-phenylacetyl-CoA epoxidase subunit PaaD [Actinomycetota bacterium]|nr:1,2-phenylacetyl-CoA epoxidase subunit PaaD [Actinomycetota bacterium]
MSATLADAVWTALGDVMDPEIPAVSITEMGMVLDVAAEDKDVWVTILPTFTGCPAIDVIVHDVEQAVAGVEGVETVRVKLVYDPPWSTERISSEGRTKLQQSGLAPPAAGPVLITDIRLPAVAVCPFCGGRDTANENLFGPTPCRAIYYCRSCRNPFEQFKQV